MPGKGAQKDTPFFTNPRLTNITVFLLGLALLLHCLLRYEGIQNWNYRETFQYPLDHSLYPNDIFVTKALLYGASIVYPLIEFFSIDFTKDLVGFWFYLFFSFLSVWACFAMVKRQFEVTSNAIALIMLLAVVYGELKPLHTVQGALFLTTFPNPTWFAHTFSFVAMFFLSQGSIGLAAVSITITLALLFKAYWILLPIMGFCILLNPKISKANLLWFFLPLAFVAYKAKTAVAFPKDHELLLEMCKNVITRTTSEDSFNLAPKKDLFLFALTFPFYFGMVKGLANQNLKIFLRSVGISTLAVAVLGGLYTSIGYLHFPNPMLIMMSPVRAVYAYAICLILVSTYWILFNPKFLVPQKVAYLLPVLIIRFNTPATFYVSIVLVLFGFLYPRIVKKDPNQLKENAPLVFAAMFCLMTLKPVIHRWPANINLAGFRDLGSWTVRPMDPELFKVLLELRTGHDDFILMAFQDGKTPGYVFDDYENSTSHPERFTSNGYANYIARKSKYVGDTANFYFSRDLTYLAWKRMRDFNLFLDKLNESPTSEDLVTLAKPMSQDGVLFLLPNSLPELIKRAVVVKTFPTFTLVKFPTEPEKSPPQK